MEAMAASNLNGASAKDSLSPAQRLMAQQQAAEAHGPTVEDALDEEDVAHPPPSSIAAAVESGAAVSANGQMSETAAGKQKAAGEPALRDSTNKKSNAPPDTMSEEAFPSLGGSRPQSTSTTLAAWTSKPASVSKGQVNGTGAAANGTSLRPSNASSGTSTPAYTGYAPSTAASPQLQMPKAQKMSLPGRQTDAFGVPASLLKPRSELKKPMQEILREFNKRSKAKVEMTTGDGLVNFSGQGPTKETATQAIKEIVSQLCSKQSDTVMIPASVRPHIIGRQGATINGISKRTGAKVQVPNKSGLDSADDEGADVGVEIQGDPIAVAYARREIEAIVNERNATANFRLKEIPVEFFAHLTGPHNSGLNALEEGRDIRIQIPQYHTWDTRPSHQDTSANEPTQFSPHPKHYIQISGDRVAAMQVREEIERHVQDLRRQLTLKEVAIERGRHQFIIGERGATPNDFLKETGCSIILPPASEGTEIITIIGPPDQIESAVNRIEDLAYSRALSTVDIARQHQNARFGPQAHARHVTQYLRQRAIIEELERQHNASISLPPYNAERTDWDIYSKENRNLVRARQDVLNLINGLPPARLQPVNIHPFYQSHLSRRHAKLVRDQFGVHLVFPEEVDDSPEVLLVYEGRMPPSEYQLSRNKPSEPEVAEFAQALEAAEQYIMGIIGSENKIVDRSIETPSKFREKVHRFAARQIQNLTLDSFPVQVLAVEGSHANGAPIKIENVPVQLRGPIAAVDDLSAQILAFIQEQIQDEAERSYTTSVDFPQKFVNVLIGKRGDNVNRLRDDFDVDFQVGDGKVEIKGPKAKAEAARSHLIALARKLEDETTHVLKLNPQFHRDLIGAKGSQVIRLQERYNVRINFPRTSPSPADGQSVADEMSDAGAAPRGIRTSQGPDEVIIRGPKKGADDARNELLDLYQYIADNSHITTVSVAQSQLPSLIGQGGRELESMRLTTGAKIDIPGSKEAIDPSGRVDVKVKGTKAQVDAAKKLLQQRVKVFDNSITKTVEIDKRHHQALIGRQGENVRRIINESGATASDPRELARIVQFPKANSTDNVIRVEGDKDVVDKIVAAIHASVAQRESQVTEILEVPPERHGALIGRGGSVRKHLETEFKVTLNIPSTATTGPARSAVKITGLPSDVANAKEKITSMLKEHEGETVLVPRRLHHTIADGDNGNFFRNLSRNLKVTVDHAGQQRPSRPAAPEAPPALITSEPETHWEIVEASTASDEADADATIPWILRGPEAANVAKAKEMVLAAISNAGLTCTGFLTLSDPKDNRHVIGAGGTMVNKIRRETGCSINVPKAGAKTDAIEIRGSKEVVEQAKDMILDAVDEATRYTKR